MKKRALDSLEPDLQIAVSCYVGLGNRTRVLHKSNKNPLTFAMNVCYSFCGAPSLYG